MADTAKLELKDAETHEDIEKFVDQIVEDRKEEETEETEETDSQQLAEDHDEPKIAETNTGNEDTAEGGEDAGDSESQAQEWLDDDLKAEIAAYGIDETEFVDFTSREEVKRALRFSDRRAQEVGRKAMTESAKGGEGKETETVSKSEPKEGQYEISLEGYDEDLVGVLTGLRDHYESRFDAMEARFAETAAAAEEQHFDGIVDSLGHADLFGKTGKESPKQHQRREDLLVAAKAQQLGLERLGRPTDFDESLVNRVARMVFAEDLSKKELKARTRKVSKQSNGRMGGSPTKAGDPPETLKDEMRRKYKELDA